MMKKIESLVLFWTGNVFTSSQTSFCHQFEFNQIKSSLNKNIKCFCSSTQSDHNLKMKKIKNEIKTTFEMSSLILSLKEYVKVIGYEDFYLVLH